MASLSYFIGIFLLAFSPHMCPAIPRNIPVSEMPNVTYSILTEIDATVQATNDKAAKFVPQIQELLQKLNTSATRGVSEINNSLKNTLASFKSDLAKLFANANATDTRDCEDYAATTQLAVPNVMKTVESCVNGVMNEAEERIALTLSYIDSKLDGLTEIQKKASKCTENMKGTDSSESEIRKTYSCAKQGKWEVDYYEDVLSSVINFVAATVLYRGWANRVGCCTSMSEAESFKYATELLYSEIETCISKAAIL